MGSKHHLLRTAQVFLFSILFLNVPNVLAATVTLSGDGGNGSFEADNHGGYEYNDIEWDGTNFVATTSLAVYDSVSQDIDNVYSGTYKGGADVNDAWANNQSGIQLYSSPVDGMPACVADVAAQDGGDPSVPISFEGANTGLTVEQFVYTGADAPFVIFEYTIINNTGTTKDVKVAHFNDFDVFSNPNEDMGYDSTNKLVWQWDAPSGYIAGTALMQRNVSNWFLENCCTMTWGDYSDQLGFFTDDPAFNGDKDTEPEDLEVDIATYVGTLGPGESATVAFAIAPAKGADSSEALANLQNNIAAAANCYDSINPPPSADDDDDDKWYEACFIATTAYGSNWEPQAMTLRQFRDSYLLTNKIGTQFVEAYNKFSPPIADFISEHKGLRSAARIGLAPVVGFSWLAVHYGVIFALTVLFSMLGLIIGGTCLLVNKQKNTD